MKLCRYGNSGQEKPGLVDAQNVLRDLSSVVNDIDPAALSPAGLKKLAALKTDTLPAVSGNPRLGVPLTGTRKFIGIGLNYSDHAKEAGATPPTEPIIFMKTTYCMVGPNDDVVQPPHSTKLDWEVELAVVIGSKAQYVSEDDALNYVAGYCLTNDVSERAFQTQCAQWDKGKGCDTFGPLGPWIVTSDEVGDPQKLDMWLDVNGERMQSGTTSTMIFSVRKLVSYCSHYLTLEPGDVIATGTPPGVGMGKKPNPIWLKPGDVMTLGVTGLGEQKQTVVAWKKS